MLWVYFTILATASWAISNLIDKYVLDKYVQNPMIGTIFMGFLGLIGAIIISQFTEVFIPSTNILVLSLIGGMAYVVAVLYYFKAIVVEEVSRVIPLFSISPIFTLILATIFLGEIFTVQKYLGILIIVAGSFLISLRKDIKFTISKSLRLMIISCLFFAINGILLKYILNSLTYWNAFVWTRVGAFLPIPILFYINRESTIKTIRDRPKSGLYLSISESFNLLGLFLITVAISYGFISLISALGGIQNFIVLVVASLLSIFKPQIIKEELKGSTILQKIVAIMMIVSGAVLII